MKRIGVIGVGAIGGYVGSKFLQHGFDVSFLASPKSVKTLQQKGLKVFSSFGNLEFVKINVSQNPVIIKDVDVILLCTKSQNTAEVAKSIKPYLKKTAVILSLQNGIENEEILSNILDKENIISALVYISSVSPEPGIINQSGPVELVIGELNNKISDRIKLIQKILIDAEIPTQITKDYKRGLWLKLLTNSVYNGFNALLGDDFKKIAYCESGKDAFYAMLKEGQKVANADSVRIDDNDISKIMEITNTDSTLFNTDCSTLQDIKKLKQLEIDYIQGAIIRKGEEYGILTPFNKFVYSLLKIKELNVD